MGLMQVSPTPDKLHFPPPVAAMLERLARENLDHELATEAAVLIVQLASMVHTGKVDVCLTNNLAARRGVTVKLSPNQTVLTHCLATSYPNVVPLEKLGRALWGPSSDKQLNTVRVLLTELRPKIALLGVTIENKHGKGYRLELHGELS